MAAVQSLRVLVTGGSGFVGSAVTADLTRRGHSVIATTTRDAAPRDQSIDWVIWDALVEPVPAIEWQAIDVILHLALPRRPLDHPDNATAIFETCVAVTFHLLEVARRHGIGRVLAASTGDALGAAGCAREDEEVYRPTSFYGTAKACQELLMRRFEGGDGGVILRFFHPYGPGGDAFLVNRMLQRVVADELIEIEGPDGIEVNPVWIDDLARGVCQAVESRHGGVFHFAGPDTLRLRALLELCGGVSQHEPRIRTRDEPAPGGHAGDFERAVRVLGYHPTVGVGEGVSRLLAAQSPA